LRSLVGLVILLTLLPAGAEFGGDLDELLERGRGATYSAEQVISCSTPDGDRDALVRIDQVGGELRLTTSVGGDVEVVSGAGDWTLTRSNGQVVRSTVDGSEDEVEALYNVEEEGEVEYLGRTAMAYLLVREEVPRAELVIDEETGTVVHAVTFTIDNEIYCERRFLSLDTDAPVIENEGVEETESIPPTRVETSDLPESVTGFELLDEYEDQDGVRFAYYSDGFFSFAVFETPMPVAVPEALPVEFDSGAYGRVFTAGQVTYVWETREAGMALVGDLPPDLHEAVLAAMPHPEDPGLFRRWWRALFG
jgi:hypothetical protein